MKVHYKADIWLKLKFGSKFKKVTRDFDSGGRTENRVSWPSSGTAIDVQFIVRYGNRGFPAIKLN